MDIELEKVQQDMMDRAVRAARAYLKETYTSPGGITRQKRPIDRRRDAEELEHWAEAVWISRGHLDTQHYWRSLAVGMADTQARAEQATADEQQRRWRGDEDGQSA